MIQVTLFSKLLTYLLFAASHIFSDGEYGGDSGSDESLEVSPYLVNHKSSSRRGTGGARGGGDTAVQQKNLTSNGHDSSLTHASAGDAEGLFIGQKTTNVHEFGHNSLPTDLLSLE